MPIVVVTMFGRSTGFVRKQALIRITRDGEYGLVASFGGAADHPVWYHNLLANPDDVTIQDGPESFPVRVREVDGAEREEWWQRGIAVYPKFAEYEAMTDRRIPVLVAGPF